MYNNEVLHKTSAEVNIQISSYFDIVDNAVAMSDTNRKYVIDSQASYSPSAPIHAGSFTTFIISPTSNNTADIYNGFLKANITLKLKINEAIKDLSNVAGKYELCTLSVGYKDAMDSVSKYEILANGISIYTLVPRNHFLLHVAQMKHANVLMCLAKFVTKMYLIVK